MGEIVAAYDAGELKRKPGAEDHALVREAVLFAHHQRPFGAR